MRGCRPGSLPPCEAASGWPLGRPVSRKSARLCVHVTHAARQARGGLGLASRPARNALRWESRPRCGAQGRVPRDSPSSERLRLDLPASCLYIARCEARLLLVQRAARGDAGIERAVLPSLAQRRCCPPTGCSKQTINNSGPKRCVSYNLYLVNKRTTTKQQQISGRVGGEILAAARVFVLLRRVGCFVVTAAASCSCC